MADPKIFNQNYNDRKFEELRLLYSLVLDDIRFFKNQQIKYLYYTITLFSVLVFIVSIPAIQNSTCELKIAFSIMSFFIMLIGIWFTYITQSDINNGRKRVTKIIPYFTKDFNEALDRKEIIKKTMWISGVSFIIFISIQVLAELIFLYILWSNIS